MAAAENQALLEISFPFCERSCRFCWLGCVQNADTSLMHRYMLALEREIEANGGEYRDLSIAAVRFGGGMVNLASGGDLLRLFRLVHETLSFEDSGDVATTMIVSPFGVNGDKMTALKRLGVTLFDIEMPSLDAAQCHCLGCPDASVTLPYILPMLKAQEQHNTGATVVYESPANEANVRALRKTLLALVHNPFSHIRIVCSSPENGEDDGQDAALADARALLSEHGLSEYLPLRFSRNKCYDRFEQLNVQDVPKIGFGVGAVSKLDGILSANTSDLALYLDHSADYQRIVTSAIRL
jgi:oxygen-independent coproporphyrinogen-3 oxidase